MGGSYQGLEVGACPKWVLVFPGLALRHMTTSNCKGDWETRHRHVQAEAEGLDLGKLLGASQRIECGGLFIYIANLHDPCPTAPSREESVGISKRKECCSFPRPNTEVPLLTVEEGKLSGAPTAPQELGPFLRRSQQVSLEP